MDDACKYFAEGLCVKGLVRLSCGIEDSEVEDFVEDLRNPWEGLEDEDSGCEVTYVLLRAGQRLIYFGTGA